MKSQLSNSLKLAKLLPVCIFLSVSFHCFADTYVTLYTSNCTTTPNSITFDVYIVNNGSTTLGWSDGSLQFTIDSTVFESYNITDDCTLAYVDGTSDFPLAYSSDGGHSEKYSASTRTIKIKLVSGYYEESLDNVVSLPENLPRRIGRYILTNTTQNFVTGASVNLTWIDDSYTYAGCTATGTNLTHYFAGSSTRSLTTPCSMTIASCAAATLSSSITNISCHGKNDGAIDLTASGGTSPLTYSWTKDADASFSASTEDISGLDAGTYNVTVSTTGDTCSASASYTITEPSALDTITTKVSACDSYTWDIDNTAYTSSGIYDTTIDCQPYKLNLTITGSTTDTTTASACGSYTWGVNGTTYTSGGTYMYINGCSTKVLNLTIYNSRPDMPGSISGTKFNLCNASEGICSVTATSDAASYTWAPISGGLSISSGNGTNSITLSIPADFVKGKIRVIAVNSCGKSKPKRALLQARPAKPIISGPACVSANETGLTYTVTNAVAGITYTWHVPGAAKITNGQGTSTVTVTWRGNSGVIQCTPSNSCAAGARASYTVTVGCASAATVQTAKNVQLQAYPNPSAGLINVVFSSAKETKYKLVITDITGRQIISKEITASAGSNKVNIDISKYANGIYMLSLISDKGVQTVKVLKQ